LQQPFANFQTRSGSLFTAAEDGSIVVEATADREDLLNAGCRPANWAIDASSGRRSSR
jgi:hypothetical protein